eukprot:15445412-Alexandrium_andersonii.AAC.1
MWAGEAWWGVGCWVLGVGRWVLYVGRSVLGVGTEEDRQEGGLGAVERRAEGGRGTTRAREVRAESIDVMGMKVGRRMGDEIDDKAI